jgi:hypothetical protein
MNIFLGNFNAKVGMEDIFKPTIGNYSLHEFSIDNEVGVVNFATQKKKPVKRICCHVATSICARGIQNLRAIYFLLYSPKVHKNKYTVIL